MAQVVGHTCDNPSCSKFETVAKETAGAGTRPPTWFRVSMPKLVNEPEVTKEFCTERCVENYMKDRRTDLFGTTKAPSKIPEELREYFAQHGITGKLMGSRMANHSRYHATRNIVVDDCLVCQFEALS